MRTWKEKRLGMLSKSCLVFMKGEVWWERRKTKEKRKKKMWTEKESGIMTRITIHLLSLWWTSFEKYLYLGVGWGLHSIVHREQYLYDPLVTWTWPSKALIVGCFWEVVHCNRVLMAQWMFRWLAGGQARVMGRTIVLFSWSYSVVRSWGV